MKSQDQIILETEMILENCRQSVAKYKSRLNEEQVKECFNTFEKILFEIIVLFYTHRTVWTQPSFWYNYAPDCNVAELSKSAYDQMIKSTLATCYANLYFCIEHSLYQYYFKNTEERNIPSTILKMYEGLDKQLIPNYDETKKGLEILRNVRNSFHSKHGIYIFAFNDTEIIFKNKHYKFQKHKPTEVSYKFLRDFIPDIVEMHKELFIV